MRQFHRRRQKRTKRDNFSLATVISATALHSVPLSPLKICLPGKMAKITITSLNYVWFLIRGRMMTLDEDNLFVCKDDNDWVVVEVEVVESQEEDDGLVHVHLCATEAHHYDLSRTVPIASLVPFTEQLYHQFVLILEEDAASSGYEWEERERLWKFHNTARLALYILATMRPDSEAGYQRIEQFRQERMRRHPDVFKIDRAVHAARCYLCRANPCYSNCLNYLRSLARI
jgi:hypothetical protein